MRAPPRVVLATVLLASLSFVSTAWAQLKCPADFRPPIHVSLSPPRPCGGDSVALQFSVCGCITDFEVLQDSSGITVRSSVDQRPCPAATCIPDTASVSLGHLAAGHFTIQYTFETSLTLRDSLSSDSLVCIVVHPEELAFDVLGDCGVKPPGPLPFVTAVHIGSPGACDTCPPVACPGESIKVVIEGAFDSSCLHLSGVEMVLPFAARTDIPSPGPIPAPPRIRLIYDRLVCPGITCFGTLLWSTQLTLPPLPPRSNPPYELAIAAVERKVNCSGPTDSITLLGASAFPFTVAPSCSSVVPPPGPSCLLSKFDVVGRPGDDHRCDAFFSPGHTTSVNFKAGSGKSLFGLQGEFKLDPPKLQVTKIEAIGPAAGMHLQWRATDHGATFVLFSDGTPHIPPIDPSNDSSFANILKVTVAMGTEDSGPGKSGDKGNVPKVKMVAQNLLGADSLGHGVNPCPIISDEFRFDSFVVFCRGEGCDFNGDGSTDVRDLVAMVNCLNDSTLCPPGAIPPDCDGDNVFALPDVMCCANEILNGGHPDHGGGHHDASLHVTFGLPVQHGDLLEIPVTLDGANPIGGARLAFNFPSDRFTVRDVQFSGDPECLSLYQAGAGRVDVGLLELNGLGSAYAKGVKGGQAPSASSRAPKVSGAGAAYHQFTLRLALKPGQTAGGDLSLSIADISDPQGSMVSADLGTPIASLGSGGELMLAPARPNPFGRQMSFAVTMAHAGDLDVSIHDVSGRVVTSLHHGALAAGAHSFTWDGSRSDGTRAPNGIYFYRVRANGHTLSSKVVMIREQ